MHPFALYLAITGNEREHGWTADNERRATFAQADAMPIATSIAEPERLSRIGRLAAMVRRHVMRTAGA